MVLVRQLHDKNIDIQLFLPSALAVTRTKLQNSHLYIPDIFSLFLITVYVTTHGSCCSGKADSQAG